MSSDSWRRSSVKMTTSHQYTRMLQIVDRWPLETCNMKTEHMPHLVYWLHIPSQMPGSSNSNSAVFFVAPRCSEASLICAFVGVW